MLLSIIIINYNVRYFLEQCLYSVQHAVAGMEAEVIVVDNASSDDSIAYLQPIFPSVNFIANRQNLGFARANNEALAISKGEYVLFLNPDTLIPEDGLQKCISFLQANANTGALGVQMLDGRGRFLPESKRAFPSPIASFYKLTGLAALFPGSAVFNRYALGGLDKDQDHEVPVLAGAFLMGRTGVLKELGGFDEDYFLYGEDIDLSYRINKAGWKTAYFAGTSIIHFKGESSGKAPLDRVTHFYRAMRIFVQKHYRGNRAGILLFFLGVAIRCRAGISFLAKLIKPILLPLIDMGLVWLSLQVARTSWVRLFRDGHDFHVPFIPYALPLFAGFFVLSAALTGLYDKTYRSSRTLVSLAFAIITTLAAYSLLPETVRFSRGVIIFGSVAGALLISWFRVSLFKWWHSRLGYTMEQSGQTVVVGDEQEYAAVKTLLENAFLEKELLGRVAPGDWAGDALCLVKHLPELLQTHDIRQLVFCEGSLSLSAIIAQVQRLDGQQRILFHMRGSHGLVGSDMPSITGRTIGWINTWRIAQPYQQRMKRLVDILVALLYLLMAPFHFLFLKNPIRLLRNTWRVLWGDKTWVGYLLPEEGLPELRKQVIPQSAHLASSSNEIKHRSDRIYAGNYDWWQEVGYIFSQYRQSDT
jgi:GT2 family glycosyltransferase